MDNVCLFKAFLGQWGRNSDSEIARLPGVESGREAGSDYFV